MHASHSTRVLIKIFWCSGYRHTNRVFIFEVTIVICFLSVLTSTISSLYSLQLCVCMHVCMYNICMYVCMYAHENSLFVSDHFTDMLSA